MCPFLCTRVVRLNFGILGLRTMHAYYENHHSKAKTISKLTLHSQLLPNFYSPEKNLNFVIDEVWEGCLKLGNTSLYTLHLIKYMIGHAGFQGELSVKKTLSASSVNWIG